MTSNTVTKKGLEQKNNSVTALILILCCHGKSQDMPTNLMS